MKLAIFVSIVSLFVGLTLLRKIWHISGMIRKSQSPNERI